MQMDVHKTLYLFYTTKLMPRATATVTKMRFFVSNIEVGYITIIYTIGYLQFFQAGFTSFQRSIAIVFNETTNCDF